MKYYRVKFGYGKDDFYSVDENEAKKAIQAQITGAVAILSEGTIAGNHIMSIRPDYNRLLGLNREYELKSDDYKELPAGIEQEYQAVLAEVKSNQKLLN